MVVLLLVVGVLLFLNIFMIDFVSQGSKNRVWTVRRGFKEGHCDISSFLFVLNFRERKEQGKRMIKRNSSKYELI